MKANAIILSLYVCGAAAESNYCDIYRMPMSQYEERKEATFYDAELDIEKSISIQPASYDCPFAKRDSQRRRNIVSATYNKGESTGDFLPVYGNGARDGSIAAHGEYKLRGKDKEQDKGTMFGSVQYGRGIHNGIGWNAMRFPELYLPYIATDSCGGDTKYEIYEVVGGYAFTVGKWNFGIEAKFVGEQAYRMTDPRILTNTSFISAKLGMARAFGKNVLMFSGGYERNKQYDKIQYWRPAQQDRFFIAYGFGLYDISHSSIAFGYSRMYYNYRKHFSLDFLTDSRKRNTMSISLKYKGDKMQTEESSIKSLYKSKTNSLNEAVLLNSKFSEHFSISICEKASYTCRRGIENIFEEYLVDEGNNIYDFRKIGSEQNYICSALNAHYGVNLRWSVGVFSFIGIGGGARNFMRREENKEFDFLISNRNFGVSPSIFGGYRKKRSEFHASARLYRNIVRKNSYDVRIENTNLNHLDFQHAFTPYAYYSANYNSVLAEASYMINLHRFSPGIKAVTSIEKGTREKSARYDDSIGFASSAPMIKTLPDRHNEVFSSVSLFVRF